MKTIFAFILSITPALAQQQSPMEQALGQKLLTEINAMLQCTSAQIVMQGQLQAAQARVKELESKYEPKADSPSK